MNSKNCNWKTKGELSISFSGQCWVLSDDIIISNFYALIPIQILIIILDTGFIHQIKQYEFNVSLDLFIYFLIESHRLRSLQNGFLFWTRWAEVLFLCYPLTLDSGRGGRTGGGKSSGGGGSPSETNRKQDRAPVHLPGLSCLQRVRQWVLCHTDILSKKLLCREETLTFSCLFTRFILQRPRTGERIKVSPHLSFCVIDFSPVLFTCRVRTSHQPFIRSSVYQLSVALHTLSLKS